MTELEKNQITIEQYTGFLTHADFVPHNFRINGTTPYLLDYASIHFGNKHESWARFMNFMMLYNPPLNSALTQYVQNNRSTEELASLRLMRLYKTLFLLSYYTQNLDLTSQNIRKLTELRLAFWGKALTTLRTETELSSNDITAYTSARDALRDAGEKTRQENLH
jgi:tRNA A-37 threonylcarbamoyl transferase component Bud32